MNLEDLELAKKARLNSYSPYSNYQVGCALRTKSGKVYLGCNIENHGLLSICGERCAFTKAFSEGEPTNNPENYVAIAVVGYNKDEKKYLKTVPCGYCRQFMSEFVNKNFIIYTCDNENYYEYTLEELLPNAFDF